MTLNQANHWIVAGAAHFTMNEAEVTLSLRGRTVRSPCSGKLEELVADRLRELEAALNR